ncbi:MAG: alpha/beta hydrolase [Ignavibacteria bacterium]|nr:alpha/beta hydrolase [Ignavibacteria bacterium]
MKQKFAVNGELKIEYLHVNEYAVGTAYVIVPGACVSAHEFYDCAKDSLLSNAAIISVRGLGESSKPEAGYSADDFVSDIHSVLDASGFDKPCLIGHSAGAGIAAAYAVRHPAKIKALVLADYPPGIPKYTVEWGERVRDDRSEIDKRYIDGMVNESVKHLFADEITEHNIPALVLKADGEDSILPGVLLDKLKVKMPHAEFVTITGCGHDIFGERAEEAFRVVEQFLAKGNKKQTHPMNIDQNKTD